MPVIQILQRDGTPFAAGITRREPGRPDTQTWITVGIIAGTMLLATAFVVSVTAYLRRRQYRLERRREPQLSWNEFQKRSKMTAEDRMDEEEVQRCIMIRKSLASRSFGPSSQADSHSIDVQDGKHTGLKEDWKEWEARMTRERSNSPGEHPALISSPEIPIPDRARSNSSTRSPPLKGQTAAQLQALPQLESLPGSQTTWTRPPDPRSRQINGQPV